MSASAKAAAMATAAQVEMEGRISLYLAAALGGQDQSRLETLRREAHDVLDARLDLMDAIGISARIGADKA
jgi:hypothetical protein